MAIPQLYLPQWGQQVGQNIRNNQLLAEEREQKNMLAQALPAALGGDKNALAQVYAQDPSTGARIQQSQMERQTKTAADHDSFIDGLDKHVSLSILNSQNPAGDWAAIRGGAIQHATQRDPSLGQRVAAELPEQWNDSYLLEAKADAGIKPEQPKPQGLMNISPGGSVFDPAKQETVYQAPYKPEAAPAPSYQNTSRTLPDGTSQQGIFDAHTGAFTPQGEPVKATGKNGASPVPVTALKAMRDSREALRAAETMEVTLERGKKLVEGGLDTGPISRGVSSVRNTIGMGDKNSRGLLQLKQIKEKLRSDYLLLAKGVQTEGDAVRAMDSMMPDTNDPKAIVQQFDVLKQATKNLQAMHAESLQSFQDSYPQSSESAAPAAAAPKATPTEGQTATNKATGEKIKFIGGRWVKQ